jgi:O6-methylguanine-DNA--protein-cysteine methyltransferase
MTANSCVVVPSHWVGAAMGPSGQYAGGAEVKRALLALEAVV